MLRVGLVGLGVWGKRLLKKILDSSDFELLAVFDPRAPEDSISVPFCASKEEFWAFPLEAVFVAAPPDVQGSLGLEVLQRGLALFIEKPMALSQTLARAIVELSSSAGLIVHVDHLVRYDPLHIRALEQLRSGGLGEIVGSLHVRLGARPRPGVAPHSVLLPHDLSLAHAALGDEGEWVATFTQAGLLMARRRGTCGPSVGLLSGASGPPRRQTLYAGSRRTALVEEGKSLRIYPALASELLRELEGPLEMTGWERIFSSFASIRVLEEQLVTGDPLGASLVDFARAVRTGRPTICDAMEGARVTGSLIAIDEALRRGQSSRSQFPSLMTSAGSRKSSLAEGASGDSLKR